MPAPTSATLTGPGSGECSEVSDVFVVTLDQPAAAGGVEVTVADTVGTDIVSHSPFIIAAGDSTGTFTITPATCGDRSISITTNPALTIVSSPATYSSLCACPDDTGTNDRVQAWTTGTPVCPTAFSVTMHMTPTDLYAKDLYCTTSVMTITLTE